MQQRERRIDSRRISGMETVKQHTDRSTKMKEFIRFVVVVGLSCMLTACMHDENPVSEINDSIQQNVKDLIDYANNNMEIDSDNQFLIQGLKDCAGRADAMAKVCNISSDKCSVEKNKLKLERNGLFVFVLLLIGIILYKPIRKFLPL